MIVSVNHPIENTIGIKGVDIPNLALIQPRKERKIPISSNFMIMPIRHLSLILCLGLAGCATISQPPAERLLPLPPSQTGSLKTSQLRAWDIQGAIAVRTEQKGWNASFNWSQKYANYCLNIFGPLGSHRISLIGNNQYAILTTADKKYKAANAETLLAQQLGWYMPVNNIHYWIQGLPAPGDIHHLTRNAQGQLMSIDQQGWHIEYLSYDNINGLDLPTLIELQNSRIFIRIAIHQWNF